MPARAFAGLSQAFAGRVHEVLSELIRSEVVADLQAWVDRVPVAPR
jgi:hypothetical protein